MANKLQGKVAIVTGGASGIGEATVRLFASHGARMVVIADIQADLGQELAKSIASNNCTYFHCDVTDESQVQNLVESTVRNYGNLDIMFGNAGVINRSEQAILDLDFAEYDRVLGINAKGMAITVKHAARVMVERRVRGSIICTGSVSASHGSKVCTDYTMAKHAVLGLVKSACKQLGQHGIRVNCVSPNALATALTMNALGMSMEEVEKRFENSHELKGITLKAKHIADAVLFLACDDSEFISGHDLLVDGGFIPE